MTSSPSHGWHGVAVALRAAEDWIEQETWSGVSGATDWTVSQAILKIIQRAWNVDVGLAVREVAEISGVTRQTAAKSLRRLDSRGFVRRTHKAKGAHPARYALRLHGYTKSPRSSPSSSSSFGSVHALHHGGTDVFRFNALPLNARRVWSTLLKSQSMTVSELSVTLALDRGTVRRNLKRLEKAGLTSQTGCPTKWSGLARDLDALAIDLGTSGSTRQQVLGHQAERKRFYLCQLVT